MNKGYSIFEIDENGKATGIVHFFCSLEHAEQGGYDENIGYSVPEPTTDVCPGNHCELCDRPLDETELS